MEVERWDEAQDGPLTELSLRRKLESRGYRVSRYVYPPGTSFPTHTHEVDKMDAVFSGRFRIATRDGEVVLGPGDAMQVRAGARHSAEVVGEEPVVSLDGIKVF
jgi:quercetin dioxygenase-like cupin family protein